MSGGVGRTFTGDGARRRSRADDGDDVGSLARVMRGGVGMVSVLQGGGDCIVNCQYCTTSGNARL